MAIAETAALISELILRDKFTPTANKFDRTLTGLERQTSSLGRIGNDVSRGLGTASANLQRLGVAGVGFLAGNVALGLRSIARLEEVTVATNAVIESTAGVAGITAQKVRQLAEEYEGLNATMDDKVIQSGENLLLTFTNITEKAFEPALEAALNMNQALGGGEEGLQGNIIMVGKALQDPIRGLTALRRVGVNFSSQQQEQIRGLVEANDLFGAQQIILKELGTEFGGQFAAAGTTATAKFARFRDVIEDTQMTLATAFLPVLEKAADKIGTLLADPAVIAGIQQFGGDLAQGFDELISIAGDLPWSSIGDAFRLMGTGSKALLDAFLGLPPWVQTAVLTGWGLNKLTGGALGSIVGTLASGLIKGVLGITAAVVNINAGTVTGGGGTVTGGGGGLGNVVKAAGAATGIGAIAFALFSLAGGEFTGQIRGPLADILGQNKKTTDNITKLTSEGRGGRAEHLRASAQRSSEAARALQAMNYVAQQQVAANSRLSGILAKPTSFTSNNNVTVNIDGRKVAGVITKGQFFAGTVPK